MILNRYTLSQKREGYTREEIAKETGFAPWDLEISRNKKGTKTKIELVYSEFVA